MAIILNDLKLAQDSEQFKSLDSREKTQFNCNFLKMRRDGNYLIKVVRNYHMNYVDEDQMYIDFSYNSSNGWFALSSRKDAQYFSSKEAHELIQKIFKKGFTICKRDKR